MADDEFSYRLNDETGRWDVLMRRSPDGPEEVLRSFDMPDEAMRYVARITESETGPSRWTKKPRRLETLTRGSRRPRPLSPGRAFAGGRICELAWT
jgi:hypothetical protein